MDLLLLQTDIMWLDVDSNLATADEMIARAIARPASVPGLSGNGDSATGTGHPGISGVPDLIVLPEMFATGFCMDAAAASAHGEKVVEWMKRTAARYDAAVAGTVAVNDEGRYYNRFWFVRPDGEAIAYDKRHLFTYGGEHAAYRPGTRRVTVRWRGFGILLQTCYDLRFPVFARNTGDYDLALYCASWPDTRITVWDTLLRARAIENACYVAGVNRVGTDPGNIYPGHSVVIDYKGRQAAGLPEGKAGYIRCTLSLEDLHRFREKFPVLGDADRFVLE